MRILTTLLVVISISCKAQVTPNIIFIMADDHAAHSLSCYDSDIIKTPNIDRLANEGMRFTRAVGVNSLCAPARAAILTGKHSHVNGKKSNFDKFDGDQQTFPILLQKAGYQTAIIGKWHLGVEPTGFDYYKVMKGHGAYFNSTFRETGKGWYQQEGYLTNIITDSSIDWLKKNQGDKPFCLMVHHKAPHGPDIHEEKHARLFEDEIIPEPETIHDDWDSRDPLRKGECGASKLINCHWQQDIYRELMANASREKQARTSAVYQQMIKGYMRLIASLDENVGRLLDYIDESGLRENTIIIYTSDNGFFLGDHGLFNKMWIYEESLKIPLLVRWPGVVEAGATNDSLVSILDFAPTFLDVAEAPEATDLHGHSIVPLLKKETPEYWRETSYYHFYPYPSLLEHYGLKSKRYKLHHFPDYADNNYWEFFDLLNDPQELQNEYTNPKYQEIIVGLKVQLRRHRQAIGIVSNK